MTSQDSGISDRLDLDNIDRRTVLKLAGAGGAVAVPGGAAVYASRPALAVSSAALNVNASSQPSDDGTLTDITLGDEIEGDGAGLKLNWEQFSDSSATVTFTLEARLTGNGGGSETATSTEQLLSGSVTLSGESGESTWDWSTVFGSSTVSLFTHSEIDASSFASSTDGETRTRELEVTLTASASDASASDSATSTLSLTNLAAAGSVGGTLETDVITS